MGAIDRARRGITNIRKTPESLSMDIRMQFARIINLGSSRPGWTQHKVAQEAGMKDSQISALVHGETNCTIDTMAKVMFALGHRLYLVPADSDHPTPSGVVQDSLTRRIYGQETTANNVDYECFDRTGSNVVYSEGRRGGVSTEYDVAEHHV